MRATYGRPRTGFAAFHSPSGIELPSESLDEGCRAADGPPEHEAITAVRPRPTRGPHPRRSPAGPAGAVHGRPPGYSTTSRTCCGFTLAPSSVLALWLATRKRPASRSRRVVRRATAVTRARTSRPPPSSPAATLQATRTTAAITSAATRGPSRRGRRQPLAGRPAGGDRRRDGGGDRRGQQVADQPGRSTAAASGAATPPAARRRDRGSGTSRAGRGPGRPLAAWERPRALLAVASGPTPSTGRASPPSRHPRTTRGG
jgi:hypothetical protein